MAQRLLSLQVNCGISHNSLIMEPETDGWMDKRNAYIFSGVYLAISKSEIMLFSGKRDKKLSETKQAPKEK